MEKAYYKTAIQEELARRCEKNSRYSLRSFSSALGFNSAVISQILSGKRIPSSRTAKKLVSGLGLSPEQEHDFFASLADVQRSRGLQRMSPVFKQLQTADSFLKQTTQNLDIDIFRVISDWYHYAILELTYVEGFKSDSNWIAKELNISEAEVVAAIDRLLKLHLLEVKDGKYFKTHERITTADKHLTSPALRRYQKQLLEKSIVSLENDPIEVRSMSSMTMSIDPKNIQLAKKLIDECSKQISALLGTGKKEEVYQLQISLYPLQNKTRSSK
jgi:uncharacterized protein (TIGR02147 family)